MTIANATTGQTCELRLQTSGNQYLVCDSMSGKVLLTDGTPANTSYAYFYHDNGFIDLAPGYPAYRNYTFHKESGNRIRVDEALTEDVIGQYFIMPYDDSAATLGIGVLNNMVLGSGANGDVITLRITNYEKTQDDIQYITLENSLPSGALRAGCAITRLNMITVTPSDNTSISKLIFKYKPTFS